MAWRTLWSLLEDRAYRAPDCVGFTLLDGTGAEVARATYGELAARARGVAARLQARVRPGDRVLVVCPPSLDFIAAFFGAMHAGAIAVPAYPVLRPVDAPRLEEIGRASCRERAESRASDERVK